MMMALMIPLNSIAYDEKSKWDRYAAMLPYKTWQMVWSKYLLAYLFTLLAGAIVVLGALVRGRIAGSTDWMEALGMTVLVGVSALFCTALGLPALYRFGSEKGRLAMILIMGVGIGIALGIAGIFGKIELPVLPLPVIVLILAALVVAVTYVSFRMSVYFYKKRQNGAYN